MEHNRRRPNLLITGTPGTGKTSTASVLAEATQLRHINVGDLVKEKNLHDGRDEELDCYIINEDESRMTLSGGRVSGGSHEGDQGSGSNRVVKEFVLRVGGDQNKPHPNVDANGSTPALLQTLTQAIATAQAVATAIGQASQRCVVEAPPIVDDPLGSFLKRRPKSFSGAPGTESPEDWMENIEKVFTTMSCTSEQKVNFAAFLLKGEANRWWEFEKRAAEARGVQHYTWDMFLQAFNNKYLPPSIRDMKLADFLNLEQGSMTVDEYNAEFTKLLRFAPTFFYDERRRAKKFERGLNYRIRSIVTAMNLPTYYEVLYHAHLVEQEPTKYQRNRDVKYILPSIEDNKVIDFLNLKQRSMTVDEYNAKFEELSRFLPTFFDEERQWAKKFEWGLNNKIRYILTPLDLPTYDKVLDRARAVEQDLARYRKEVNGKKRTYHNNVQQGHSKRVNGCGIKRGYRGQQQ